MPTFDVRITEVPRSREAPAPDAPTPEVRILIVRVEATDRNAAEALAWGEWDQKYEQRPETVAIDVRPFDRDASDSAQPASTEPVTPRRPRRESISGW